MLWKDKFDADERMRVLERAGTPETRNNNSSAGEVRVTSFFIPTADCLNVVLDANQRP